VGTSRRAFLINGIKVAGGLAIAACAPSVTGPGASVAPTSTGRGTLKWAVGAEIVGLEPFRSTQVSALQVYNTIYDGVTSRDANYKLQPRLAESWKLLNNTTWQFKLRPNVKFHNGDPLTAEDVKFTIEYLSNPANKTLHLTAFNTLDKIEILDPLTFNFVTKTPDPFIPDKLSVRPSYMIPANHFAKVGFQEFNRAPVGTGPFMFKEQTPGVSLVLAANKNYWRTPVLVDEIIIMPRPELSARIAALKTGEVNFIDNVDFDQVADLQAQPNTKVVIEQTTTITNWVINALVPPLDKKLVRQALDLAIDRAAINNTLYKGANALVNSPLLASEFGYDPSLPPLKYDPARARALLQQAGYANEPIIMEYTGTGTGAGQQTIVAVTEGWKSVGFNVQIRPIDEATAAQKRAQKTFLGIYTGGTASLYGDPNGVIWRQMGPGGTHRYWSNPEFDRLGVEQATSFDQTRRLTIIRRMVEIMNDEVPWLNLFSSVRLYATSGGVDWQPGYSLTDEFHPERLKFK
jgi:peptide/nickel transport system substrate-binding protein